MPTKDNFQEKRNQSNQFLTRVKHEVEHARHVCGLSLALFDQLQPLHGMTENERILLECAALLHDIGWAISGSKHHKHTLRMILNSNLSAFTERERRIVANVARYHRKSLPKDSHTPMKLLSEDDKLLVKKLGSFLRIADGLDDTHESRISSVECINLNGEVTFKAESSVPCMDEINTVERKKDLFVETFGLNFCLVVDKAAVEETACLQAVN